MWVFFYSIYRNSITIKFGFNQLEDFVVYSLTIGFTFNISKDTVWFIKL